MSMVLLFTCSLSSISYADSKLDLKLVTTNSAISINMNEDLSTKDLSRIKTNINEILSSKYEIMKNEDSINFNNIINESKLLKLINSTTEFQKQWYKSVGLKISDYDSNITLDKIKKISENKYIAEVTYDVEFTLDGSNTKSSSNGEKYEFELENKNDEWYITKILDMQEDISSDLNSKNLLRDSLLSTSQLENTFDDYEEIIDSKIKHINNITENINDYIEQYNTMKNEKNIDDSIMATSYSGYDATKAKDYALKWANSYNPEYTYYSGNDCTNFVSQCAYIGGIPASSTWYSKSPAWINVKKFYDYMRDNGYTSGGDSSSGSRIGDIIQLYNSNKSTWSHSVIITGSSNSGWLYCAHSSNRVNYPIASVYPTSTYTDIRYIKFWH